MSSGILSLQMGATNTSKLPVTNVSFVGIASAPVAYSLQHNLTLNFPASTQPRRIFFFVISRSADAMPYMLNLTLGGVAATALRRSNGTGTNREAGVFYLDVPPGTPSNAIQVTYDEPMELCFVSAFTVPTYALIAKSEATERSGVQPPYTQSLGHSTAYQNVPYGVGFGMVAGIRINQPFTVLSSTNPIINLAEYQLVGTPVGSTTTDLRVAVIACIFNETGDHTFSWQWGTEPYVGGAVALVSVL